MFLLILSLSALNVYAAQNGHKWSETLMASKFELCEANKISFCSTEEIKRAFKLEIIKSLPSDSLVKKESLNELCKENSIIPCSFTEVLRAMHKALDGRLDNKHIKDASVVKFCEENRLASKCVYSDVIILLEEARFAENRPDRFVTAKSMVDFCERESLASCSAQEIVSTLKGKK